MSTKKSRRRATASVAVFISSFRALGIYVSIVVLCFVAYLPILIIVCRLGDAACGDARLNLLLKIERAAAGAVRVSRVDRLNEIVAGLVELNGDGGLVVGQGRIADVIQTLVEGNVSCRSCST